MTDSSAFIATLPPNDLSNKKCVVNALNTPLSIAAAKVGTVHLVGAGSGDPELLTLKALRIMQSADVVLYDSLVSEDILDMCEPTAEKIFVGNAEPIMRCRKKASMSCWSSTRWQVKQL